MKKSSQTWISVVSAFAVLLCAIPGAFAHSGRTDSSGGHRDNRNKSGLGSYHYHHGYSAHLHPGGYCPYTDAFPKGVTLSAEKTTLGIHESCKISAMVSPSNACNTSVSWESSNTSVVRVKNGQLEAVGFGTATISATTFNGKRGSIKITVKEITARSVTITGIDETNRTFMVGKSKRASAKITPQNVDDPTITWTSSDPTIASVENGVIQARSVGSATITAKTANGISDKIEITVQEIVAEKLELNAPDTVSIGDTVQLESILVPADTTDQKITWSSSNESVATVTSSGMLTAKTDGDITITATQRDVQTSVTIHVLPIPVEEITINVPEEFEGKLKPEETVQFSASVLPENATYPEIFWSTSDPEIAIVDENGVLIALSNGDVTLYVRSADGVETSLEIQVDSGAGAVTALGGGTVAVAGGIYALIRKKGKKK